MTGSSSMPPTEEQSRLSFATIQQANSAFNAGEFLQARELCTKALIDYTPYHPIIYANRACVYSRLGYHDLAAGDAYRAVMLMEYIRAVLEGLEEEEDEEEGADAEGAEAGDNGVAAAAAASGGETKAPQPTDGGALKASGENGDSTAVSEANGTEEEEEEEEEEGEPASIFTHIAQAAYSTVTTFYKYTNNIPEENDVRRSDLLAFTTKFDKLASYYLVNSLRQTASLLDAYEFCESTLKRYQDEVPGADATAKAQQPAASHNGGQQQLEINTSEFAAIKLSIMNEMNQKLEKAISDQSGDVSPEKSRSILSSGVALRQKYPWNTYEPDRFSEESLAKLTENMTTCALNSGLGVIKCEPKVLELPDLSVQRDEDGKLLESVHLSKHLGIFAKQDIYADETFFVEDITISGSPHPGRRILCDYCSNKIVPHKDRDGVDVTPEVHTCPSCPTRRPSSSGGPKTPSAAEDDVSPDPPLYPAYCSQQCLRLAQASHHDPATLCGREDDLSWIYDDIIASPNPISMYSVLLIKIFATSINRNHTHPLLLEEVEYLYGIPPPSRGLTMRWDFVTCVVRPMWILTQGLGIDIYSSKGVRMFDTWVINTLLAKIMGTCSGRFEPLLGIQQECDDRPDVVNVHPTWSLVNHDCEPGVGWKPEGKGKFWGIPRRGDEDLVKSLGPNERYVSVRKGEEVKSCYTDRKLDYKVRREWARDMLGGDCICSRCVAEEVADLEGMKVEEAVGNSGRSRVVVI